MTIDAGGGATYYNYSSAGRKQYAGSGGGTTGDTAGAGGSGYIGNSKLTNKVMYCYSCTPSDEESTKTISTTCINATPQENCSKESSGYAKITLISK